MQAMERHGAGDSDQEQSQTGRKVVKKKPPSRLLMEQQKRREMGRRRRHPSLNDPPSYEMVMKYPNESSDESDEGDSSRHHLLPIQGSSSSISDKTYQNVYRDGAINTFRKLDTHIPVAHSDGDLVLGSLGGRRGNLPRLAKGQHPDHGSSEFEDPADRMYRSSNSTSRASRETVVAREELMRNKEEAARQREDLDTSPFRVTAQVHRNSRTSRGSLKHSKSSDPDNRSRSGSVKSTKTVDPNEPIYGRHKARHSSNFDEQDSVTYNSKQPLSRTGSIHSNEPIYMRVPASLYVDPGSRNKMRSPQNGDNNYSRNNMRSPVESSVDPTYSSRNKMRSPQNVDPIYEGRKKVKSPRNVDPTYESRNKMRSPQNVDSNYNSRNKMRSPQNIDPIYESRKNVRSPQNIDSKYESRKNVRSPQNVDYNTRDNMRSPVRNQTDENESIYMKSPVHLSPSRATSHAIEQPIYMKSPFGVRHTGDKSHYAALKPVPPPVVPPKPSLGDADVYSGGKNPMDVSLTSFKVPSTTGRPSPINFSEEHATGKDILLMSNLISNSL